MASPWVVVLNANGRQWLSGCLGTLCRSVPAGTPLLLVDNASTDRGPELVARRFPQIRQLRLEQNLGFVRAANLGARHALSRGAGAVVLLNNDTRMSRDWLSTLLEAARRHPGHGVLGPLQRDFHGAPSPRTQAITREWMRTQRTGGRDEAPEVIDADWVEGSCFFVKAEVFERIGWFDDLFAPAYFEEIDFCRRARRAGYRVGMVPGSVIDHHGAGSAQDDDRRRWQRTLCERNYLLYHASDPRLSLHESIRQFLSRAAWHGAKGIRSGNLTPWEWWLAFRAACGRWTATSRKRERDAAGLPCPIEGLDHPTCERLRYYRQCLSRPPGETMTTRPKAG